MRNLRTRFERFCLRNRSKGIPNLMLYISIGSAIVYLMTAFSHSTALYEALCFNRALIMQGQVWRLFTYVFTSVSPGENFLLALIGLICYYSLGRAIEARWGTFRFNLFYLTGIVLMDVFAMIFSAPKFLLMNIEGQMMIFPPQFYSNMSMYLNLSLLIAFSTLYPEARFLFMFIIPVRAWIFALLYLGLMIYQVWELSFPVMFFPHNLFPLIGLANYFLFFGKDVLNLIPQSWFVNVKRRTKKQKAPQSQDGPIPFRPAAASGNQSKKQEQPYTHKCTVCGRTDVTNPELEFRYCSKCNGYYCYCEDHINNHEHIK